MLKKTILLVILCVVVSSCANTFDSVKRGLTGKKSKSTDEFLVQKKDPLILPPDYDKLPLPEDRAAAKEERSIFQKTLDSNASLDDNNISTSGSVESSILRKIKKNK